MARNIRKARASWGRLARILGREGADLKVTRSFYTAVTQQVLLFGAESWVLTIHNTVVILDEGNLPLPRCPRCDLQVSRKALNGRHLETSQCRTGTEQKRRRLAEAKLEITSEKAFHAHGKKMRAVTEFKYLGRVLTNTDDDWPAVAGNIRKARASWGRLERILGR